MIKQIFVSYTREDYPFVHKLVEDLTERGVDTWLDQRDIQAGQRWDTAVQNALRDSDYFMVVLSPTSVGSDNVLDEISYALTNDKHIFPVLYKNCDIPYRLARVQYVDFSQDYNDGLNRLVDQYERIKDPKGNYNLPEELPPVNDHKIPGWIWGICGLLAVLVLVALLGRNKNWIGYVFHPTVTPLPIAIEPRAPTETNTIEKTEVVINLATVTSLPMLTNTPTRSSTPDLFWSQGDCSQVGPPCTYTVVQGDYFSLIADKLLGSQAFTPHILSANRDADGYRISLKPDMKLFIPSVDQFSLEEIVKHLYPQCFAYEYPCWYLAKADDTYESIATDFYNDEKNWKLISQANWTYNPALDIPITYPEISEGLILVLPKRR